MGLANIYETVNHFYPRSPCGERRLLDWDAIGYTPFLSTLSLRRATSEAVPRRPHADISIHALLAESDGPAVVRV